MRRSGGLVFACLLITTGAGRGDDLLRLPAVLDRALTGNLTLAASRRDLRTLEGRVVQAGAVPNPDAEAGVSKVDPREPSGGGSASEASLQQTVEIWGKRGLRREVARAELEAGRARVRALERDVIRQAKEAYWDLALAQERINFSQENLGFQQRFLARIQDRFQSGQANLVDVARAKLEASRVAFEMLSARKDREDAEGRLNRLMGQDVRRALPAPEHLAATTIQLDEEVLLASAKAGRAERQALAALAGGARADLDLARRLLWAPDLKAGVRYERGERGDGRDSVAGTLGLTLPFWSQYRGERQAAGARVGVLEAQMADLDQAIALEVDQAVIKTRLSAEQVALLKESVDQATEASRLAEQRYLEGTVDLSVFIQARRDWVSAILAYLESQRNHLVNLAGLEQAVGKEIQ